MSTLIVNLAGAILIIAIIGWFWLWKPRQGAHAKQGVIDIRVADGTYTPATIDTRAGETLTLNVMRTDASPCSEYLIIDGLDISEQLPLNTPHRIIIEKPASGYYPMHCQMNMYQGLLRVR